MEASPAPHLPSKAMRWLIWFGLFSAIGGYFGVLQFSEASEKEPEENLRKVLMFFGLVMMALSLGVKFFVNQRAKPDRRAGFQSWVFSAYIAALALGEAPAIFGLILGLQGSETKDTLPLFVMALITLGLNAPPLFFAMEKNRD